MITQMLKDQTVKQSPMCGEIREILVGDEYSPSVAIALDILPTKTHYHESFDEIYFVLDGYVHLRLYDPDSERVTEKPYRPTNYALLAKASIKESRSHPKRIGLA